MQLGRAGINRNARRVAVGALLVVSAVTLVLVLGGTGAGGHHLYVTVPDASNAVAGQEIREAGAKVGQIDSTEAINGGKAARLKLEIEDRAWPLPVGSSMTFRWGGTISFDNRYIDLVPGPRGGASLRNGATLPTTDFHLPVEVDQFDSMFTAKVRKDVRAFLARSGAAFDQLRPDVQRTLAGAAPAALSETAHLMQDLAADQRSLDTLIRSMDGVVHAVHEADPGLGQLLSGAATTFEALGRESRQVSATIGNLPSTFSSLSSTLGHVQATLRGANTVLDRLAPGVTEVRRVAAPLNSLLGSIVAVGPDARQTFQTARATAPSLNPFLARVTRVMPKLGSIGHQSADQLKCVRPYTPDILSFPTNWADFMSSVDGKDKLFRAEPQVFIPLSYNTQLENSAGVAKQFPGARYAFPAPPGNNAGQPWFLPECGITKDTLDPAKDPEARPGSEGFSLPPLSTFGLAQPSGDGQ
jgi:ABC-type transporter Mla subunit MlaD